MRPSSVRTNEHLKRGTERKKVFLLGNDAFVSTVLPGFCFPHLTSCTFGIETGKKCTRFIKRIGFIRTTRPTGLIKRWALLSGYQSKASGLIAGVLLTDVRVHTHVYQAFLM